MRKVKARDIVWGWRKGRSTSGPGPMQEIDRLEFHLRFAEVEGDFAEALRLGMQLQAEATYRVGQFQMEEIFQIQRQTDPEYKAALMWFFAMMMEEARPRRIKEANENRAVMEAIRRGRGIGTKDPLAN